MSELGQGTFRRFKLIASGTMFLTHANGKGMDEVTIEISVEPMESIPLLLANLKLHGVDSVAAEIIVDNLISQITRYRLASMMV